MWPGLTFGKCCNAGLELLTHFDEDSRFKSIRFQMRDAEDEGATLLLNVGNYLAVSMA